MLKQSAHKAEQNARVTYLRHCSDIFCELWNIRRWEWKELLEAIDSILRFFTFAALALLFPVVVPLAGYFRVRYYRRIWAEWDDRQRQVDELHGARVARVQSRVQKRCTHEYLCDCDNAECGASYVCEIETVCGVCKTGVMQPSDNY